MVQGAGGALVLPVGLAIVSSVFPPERRGQAIGILEGIEGMAVIAGPLLGGLIAAHPEQADITDIWADLTDIGVVLHPFDLTKDGPKVAAITAQLRRRHATDSTYIYPAQQLDTAVWTLDGPLPATPGTSAYRSTLSPEDLVS